MASAIPEKTRLSASSVRRFIKPLWLSRLRVEPTANERASVKEVEDLVFILGVWFGIRVLLKNREAVGFRVRGSNFVQENQDSGRSFVNLRTDLVKLFQAFNVKLFPANASCVSRQPRNQPGTAESYLQATLLRRGPACQARLPLRASDLCRTHRTREVFSRVS